MTAARIDDATAAAMDCRRRWALMLLTAMVRAPGMPWLTDDKVTGDLLGCGEGIWLHQRRRVEDEMQLLLKQPGLVDRLKPRRLTEDERLAVFVRAGGRCAYCGNPMTLADFHVDHVWPVALGGSDDPENLACACGPCNQSKGARTPDQWRGEP